MKNEGYVKFNCCWLKTKPLTFGQFAEINRWRKKLYQKGFIGAYPNGIGFGNMSIRLKADNFIITGTATGNFERLNKKHYTEVTGFNLQKNQLTCLGPIQASSESLTHGAIYQSSKEAKAVIHIHNLKMWNKLKGRLPTTAKNISYGTPAMAKAVKRLFRASNAKIEKIMVMGGHSGGIIAFGKNLNEAGKILLKYNCPQYHQRHSKNLYK